MFDLIQRNIVTLQQGEALLQRISDADYTRNVALVFGGSIGAHIRHNLDHYASFLDGLQSGCIDYAARLRDPRIEQQRDAALDLFKRLRQELTAITPGDIGPLRTRIDDSSDAIETATSPERELGFLCSHSVHHYAIIAILCRIQGIDVDATFGVAPSTLVFRKEIDTAVKASTCVR